MYIDYYYYYYYLQEYLLMCKDKYNLRWVSIDNYVYMVTF